MDHLKAPTKPNQHEGRTDRGTLFVRDFFILITIARDQTSGYFEADPKSKMEGFDMAD